MAGDNDSGSSVSGAEDTELELGDSETPAPRVRRRDTLAAAESFADTEDDDFDELATVDPQNYVIGPEIARGGMGRIVEGRDRRAGRTVALKEILADLLDAYSEDEREIMLRRFEREARITVGLQHPSIVPVYEIGKFGDSPFLAMKRVVGKPLDEVIDSMSTLRERLSLVPTLIAVADALAYAHERGVIHRDLKPANVLVGAHGETVVIDWGLAKQLDTDDLDTSEPGVVDSDDGLKTTVGSVFGTPLYMPPEQARGVETDRRADVYAIGAILYHILAGTPPYRDLPREQRSGGILAALKDRAPTPLGTLEPAVPPDLLSIVEKSMARTRSARYPSASELAADLRQFQAGQLVGVHEYTFGELLRRWVGRHRTTVITAAVAVGLLLALGAYAFVSVTRSSADAREARDEAQARAMEARQKRDEAVRVFTEGGRESLARGSLSDAAFSLIQAAKLESNATGIDIMLGSVETALVGAGRIGRGMTVASEHAPAGSRFVALGGQLGRVEIYDRRTRALVSSFDTGRVLRTVRISDDGETVLVQAGLLGTQVWSASRGQLTRTLDCPDQGGDGAAISPDGRHALSVCPIFDVTLFDVSTGSRLAADGTLRLPVHLIDFSTPTQVIAAAGPWVMTLRVPSMTPIRTMRASWNNADLGYLPEAMVAYAPDASGNAELLDLRDGVRRLVETQHCGLVTMSRDLTRVVCAQEGGAVTMIDASTGKLVNEWQAHDRKLRYLSVNHDGSQVATVGDDDVIRLWDAAVGQLSSRSIGATRPKRVRFIENDLLLAIDHTDGALLIRGGAPLIKDRYVAKAPLRSIAYSTDGRVLLAVGSDSVLLRRDGPANSDAVLANMPAAPFSANTKPIAGGRVVGGDGIYELTGGKHAAIEALQAPGTPRASISAGGKLAALNSVTAVRVIDTNTGRELLHVTTDRNRDMMSAIHLSEAHNSAVVATVMGGLDRYDLATGRVLASRNVRQSTRALHPSPDGKLLFASVGADALLDARTLETVRQFETISISASMTADGRFIVRMFRDRIDVHDGTGTLLYSLDGFTSMVFSYATGRDLLASTNSAGMVTLWNLADGKLVFRERLALGMQHLAVAPDDSEFAIAIGSAVLFYDVPRRTLAPDELVRQLRAVFAERELVHRYYLTEETP